MSDPRPAPLADEREPALGDLLGRVLEDGEAVVKAQLGLYRQEAAYIVEALRMPIALALLASLLAVASLILLLVAIVFALAPLVGPAWAAVIVSLAAAAVAGLMLWWVVRRGRAVIAELGKDR